MPRDHLAEPAANRAVRDVIADTLSTLGFSVSLEGRYDNVVALPLRPRGPLTLIGAHYDSVPFCPGADDNASAVAVMLEAARHHAESGADVGLVAFNAEEHGLRGSSELVADWLAAAPPIAGVHVLEMVGFASHEVGSQRSPIALPGLPRVGDFIGVIANQRSRSLRRRIVRAARRASTPTPPLVSLQTWLGAERLVPDLFRSDHAPFWHAGIPAVMWTDTAEFRNPHYHRPTDTPDTLDYDFMAGVAELLIAATSE